MLTHISYKKKGICNISMFKRVAVHFFHFHVKSLVCDICSFKFSH